MARPWLVCIAALFAGSTLAFADTVTPYKVLNQAGTASYGTITVDSTTGLVQGADLGFGIGGTPVSFTGAPASQGFYSYLDDYRVTFTTVGYELLFSLPVTSLVDYAPDDRKSCATNRVNCDYTVNVFAGPLAPGNLEGTYEGNLLVTTTAAAATPEPASLALLGTGVLGLCGAWRRRTRV